MFSKFFKNFKLNTLLIFSIFIVYFFPNNLIYANLTIEEDLLIPMGNILQIDAQLDGYIVRNKAPKSPFNIGDKLISINNFTIKDYEDFNNVVSTLNSNSLIDVLVNRGFRNINIKTNKSTLEQINFNNCVSGFATLTYIDPDTSTFGAVAHPISIGNSKNISISNGTISNTINLNVIKSRQGQVGSLSGTKKEDIGVFYKNTDFGIRGKINNFNFSNLQTYKVANLSDIQLGQAHIILQDKNNAPKKFAIQILDIENQRSAKPKTFKIQIVDDELLNMTGGIVQGMSGTPIVQDDKIIGAVSHALENDPSCGYAVYIKWMLE